MSSLTAMLDACVLIPPALRNVLLRSADAGLYRMHWSEDILEEVRRNPTSQLGRSEAQALRLVETLRTYFPEASVTGYQALIPAMTNDPKDRHVLAANVVSGSHVIVTSNLQDFPSEALAPYCIEAQSPDDFLVTLFHVDSERMIQIVVEQAQDLQNPPMSVDHVLNILMLQAPTFVAMVRAQLARPS